MVIGKVVAFCACFALVASQYPTPAETTDVQRRVLAEQTVKAKTASDAATTDVLAFLDGQEFRSELKACCLDAAQLSSQELLARLRAEMKAAELAHSFPADDTAGGHHNYDMTIAKAKQNDFWLNEWQGPVKYNTPMPKGFNSAEEGVFGLPPFVNASTPTWDEAADRLIYIVQNLRQLDFGSRPNFGDASVIFKKSYVKDNVLIAAVDTGLWERTCNKSFPDPRPEPINCSLWKPAQVGTLDHLDHLILANIGTWKTATETLAQVAGRLFGRTPFAGAYSDLQPFSLGDDNRYLEANILMNPPLPQAVSLLIGDFAALFGSDLGVSLQELAQQRGWPLVWSRGLNGLDRHSTAKSIPGNGRVLDPKIGGNQTFNASFPATSQRDFAELWSSVKTARSAAQPSQSQFDTWWTALASQQLNVAPVSAFACSDPDSCVAVEASSGQCICNTELSTVMV